MAEWFIKKVTGEDLVEKALDLAIQEEGARLIISALKPELEEIAEEQDPIIIKAEGTGAGGTVLWQSKRFEELNRTVRGSYRFLSVKGVGRIVDVFINCATSNNFSVELIVDNDSWYSGSYTELAQTSTADTHLAIYDDEDSGEYFVKFQEISFIRGFEVIIGAGNLEFDVLRANYELMV